MGIISRNANAPIQDGETASGADVESDFATIYTEFNGSIDGANLKDNIISTAKIVAAAVTQAKLTSGAATASDAQYAASPVGSVFGTSYQVLGTSVSHAVGNPARHVILMASLQLTALTGTLASVQILKDGSPITTYSVGAIGLMSFVAVDTAPTPGGTHTYVLNIKATGTGGIAQNLSFAVLEPRS